MLELSSKPGLLGPSKSGAAGPESGGEEIRSQDENIPPGNPESISQGKNTGSNYPHLNWSSREFHSILTFENYLVP